MPALYNLVVILCVLSISPLSLAQEKPQVTPARSDDVVRVTTQLVQTDVVVLDQGKFVSGLKPEQFELRVNGRTRPILFFQELTAGTANEEVQMALARGNRSGRDNNASLAVDRGRTVLFYVDDFHLSANSIGRLREMLTQFIEADMGPHDELGIFTGTGQLGFLEQFTNEKAVLRRAVEKLKHRTFQAVDSERPAMSETEAIAIMNEDRRILDYFVEQLLRDVGQPRPRQPSAATRSRTQYEVLVRGRAKSIVDQVAALTSASLVGFNKTIRAAGQLPWQKLAFFVSDGFSMVESQNSNTDLRRIADAASHSGTIVYSIDARGLISGAADASRKVPFDYTGRLASQGTRHITASQEPLRALALDAGGLPILDTNEPLADLRRAVVETSKYYQIAWRPEEQELNDRKFQSVEVSLANSANVTVRTRQGFFFGSDEITPARKSETSSNKEKEKEKKNEEGPLFKAMRNPIAQRQLPVALSVGFVDTGEPNLLVTASLGVHRESLDLTGGENRQLDLAGLVIDESGKPVASFEEDLTVKPAELVSSSQRVGYNHQLRLPPGLYQMRVALEEKKTKRLGTAMQWLVVPDLKSGSLQVSSLFIGEVDAQTLSAGKLNINADHRFPMRSILGFLTYIYNAQSGPSGPDVALQVIVTRDGQPVVTKPLVKVQTIGVDLLRIPYGEHFGLSELPAGRYVLQVNAIDRVAKVTATQQTRFTVHYGRVL